MTPTELITEAYAICVLIIVVMVTVSITLTVLEAIMQPTRDYLKKAIKHYLDNRWEKRKNG